MKRYFLIPFHSTPLVLVVTFALGLMLAIKAGFAGILLGLLLFSWFFKYCFVLFDSVVAGEDEPPVLSLEMVNPLSEQRPLVLAMLISMEGMLVIALQDRAGSAVALVAVIALTGILPANIAVFGFTRNIAKAVWPPALFTLIRTLGWNYVLLNAVTVASAGIIYWMAVHQTSLLQALLATQLLFLLIFALVAGAERGRMLDIAYSAFRVRKPLEGWQEIEIWLRAHARGDSLLAEYRAVLEAASKWDDVRAADRLANDFVALLLAKRANGEALLVVEQRLATNPNYQVLPPGQAIRIAELAGSAGKRALQRRLAPRIS